MTEAALHAGIVALGLILYAVLTSLGKDGNPVLSAAFAYGAGAGAQAALEKKAAA